MSSRCHLSPFSFCLCLLVIAMLSGCASRKIVTAVEDQSYIPGPAPQAQAPVAEAKVSPPVPPEPSKAEPSAAVQPAPLQPAPVQVEKPIPPPVAEEKLVAEQPIVPAAPSQPAVPQTRPIPELSDVFFDFDRFVIRDDARSGARSQRRSSKVAIRREDPDRRPL